MEISTAKFLEFPQKLLIKAKTVLNEESSEKISSTFKDLGCNINLNHLNDLT
jgi:hypothetical protein